MSLSISLRVDQRYIFHPNPQDIGNSPVVPGLGPLYAVSDPTVFGIDISVSGSPDIVPLKAGSAIITISGQQSFGSPVITELVPVTVTAGPLHHFAPTGEGPR